MDYNILDGTGMDYIGLDYNIILDITDLRYIVLDSTGMNYNATDLECMVQYSSDLDYIILS